MSAIKGKMEFRNWMLKKYGIQQVNNYRETETEEMAIKFAKEVSENQMKGFLEYLANEYSQSYSDDVKRRFTKFHSR